MFIAGHKVMAPCFYEEYQKQLKKAFLYFSPLPSAPSGNTGLSVIICHGIASISMLEKKKDFFSPFIPSTFVIESWMSARERKVIQDVAVVHGVTMALER